jgi:RNA polymerase sigma-70 factor (ECF subfamily)
MPAPCRSWWPLPESFREVIVLRKVEDLSYRQISEVLNVPVGTVRSRLARARATLRGAWIKTLPPEVQGQYE